MNLDERESYGLVSNVHILPCALSGLLHNDVFKSSGCTFTEGDVHTMVATDRERTENEDEKMLGGGRDTRDEVEGGTTTGRRESKGEKSTGKRGVQTGEGQDESKLESDPDSKQGGQSEFEIL